MKAVDRRSEVRQAVRRDLTRHGRRPPGQGDFWRSLRVLGMVGWPIALGAVAGTLAGRWLDQRGQSGVRWTLMLLMLGLLLGSLAAWRAVTDRH